VDVGFIIIIATTLGDSTMVVVFSVLILFCFVLFCFVWWFFLVLSLSAYCISFLFRVHPWGLYGGGCSLLVIIVLFIMYRTRDLNFCFDKAIKINYCLRWFVCFSFLLLMLLGDTVSYCFFGMLLLLIFIIYLFFRRCC
jgi:hypothetical protein